MNRDQKVHWSRFVSPGAGRATWAIGLGSYGPFGSDWWDEPGTMGLAPGPPPLVPVGGFNRDKRLPFSPDSCHQPGPMRCLYIPLAREQSTSALFFSGQGGEGFVVL